EALDCQTNWRTSERRELDRWRTIVARVLDDVSEPEACFRELYDHFARPTSWRCAPGTAAIVSDVARRGYGLALASNYDHRLRSVTAGREELRPLGRLIISSEVGWRKPSRHFFEEVCAKLQLPAEQILFIGDDPENDLRGAQRVGMRARLVSVEALRATDAN